MEWSHRLEQGIAIVSIPGNLALEVAYSARNYIASLGPQPEIRGVVINFSQVSYMDSAGISALISVFKRLGEQNKCFALCSLNQTCREVLDWMGLDQLLLVYDTEKEALAACIVDHAS